MSREETTTYSDIEPIKIRIALQETLCPPDPEIEQVWAKEANQRMKQMERGEAKLIPGEKVKEEMKRRFH